MPIFRTLSSPIDVGSLQFRKTSKAKPVSRNALQSSTSGCPFHSNKATPVQREETPTPGPDPFSFESALQVMKITRYGIHEAMLRFFEKYGPVCRFANPTNLNGKSGWVFVNSPDDIEYVCHTNMKNYTTRYLPDIYKFATNGKGILCSQGEYNRKHRSMCQPTFNCTPFLRKFSEVVVNKTRRVTQWLSDRGTEIDIELLAQRLTLDIIGEVAFSYDFNECEKIRKDIFGEKANYGEDTDAFVKAINDFGEALADVFILPMPILKVLKRFNYQPLQKLQLSIDTQRDIMMEVISDRRQDKSAGEEKKDLLGSLLQFYDESGIESEEEGLWEDVHDIMGAGHETTASSLAACLYSVSIHPEVREKVVQEVRTVLGDKPATYGDLDNLAYTRQCVKETLRLYPPIPIFPREAGVDDQLPSGHVIKQGDVVFMAGYSLGRSPDLWENPMVFDPDRFSEENLARLHKFQFCPMGAGSRMCIAPTFAVMSLTLMTATFFQCLDLRAISPTSNILDIDYDITMNFKKTNGIRMRMKGI